MDSPDVPKAAIFIPSAHRFRTEDGMELRSIERPRKQRIVVMAVALILAAVAVAGTIRAFRADHRPADERPAVAARIKVAHTPSAAAGSIRAFRADHRPADERPAVAARIKVAHTPSAIAAGRHATWVLIAATLSRIDPQTDQVEVAGA